LETTIGVTEIGQSDFSFVLNCLDKDIMVTVHRNHPSITKNTESPARVDLHAPSADQQANLEGSCAQDHKTTIAVLLGSPSTQYSSVGYHRSY
jgi:hypothetical protein